MVSKRLYSHKSGRRLSLRKRTPIRSRQILVISVLMRLPPKRMKKMRQSMMNKILAQKNLTSGKQLSKPSVRSVVRNVSSRKKSLKDSRQRMVRMIARVQTPLSRLQEALMMRRTPIQSLQQVQVTLRARALQMNKLVDPRKALQILSRMTTIAL